MVLYQQPSQFAPNILLLEIWERQCHAITITYRWKPVNTKHYATFAKSKSSIILSVIIVIKHKTIQFYNSEPQLFVVVHVILIGYHLVWSTCTCREFLVFSISRRHDVNACRTNNIHLTLYVLHCPPTVLLSPDSKYRTHLLTRPMHHTSACTTLIGRGYFDTFWLTFINTSCVDWKKKRENVLFLPHHPVDVYCVYISLILILHFHSEQTVEPIDIICCQNIEL